MICALFVLCRGSMNMKPRERNLKPNPHNLLVSPLFLFLLSHTTRTHDVDNTIWQRHTPSGDSAQVGLAPLQDLPPPLAENLVARTR